MNDSSLGQLILFIRGGSRAPSRDANFGAEGALFFAIEVRTGLALTDCSIHHA